ncbi:MAG: DUF2760 domain-containing protein [Bdellovibrionales bacterium]|nr:DUF2760 domain-containing protein [Bdellovibrionales bacterium]
MRILLAAFLGMLLSGSVINPGIRQLLGTVFPSPALEYLLFFICTYLTFEGILLLSRRNKAGAAESPASADAGTASQSAELSRLRTALEEAEARLKAQHDAAEAGCDADAVAKEAVIQFLSLLQRKARFVDFAMNDIAAVSDQQLAAATRIVHQGCSEVLVEYFSIEPVFTAAEGTKAEIQQDFDRQAIRLTGSISGTPPFNGTVVHRGWKAERVTLPKPTSAQAPETAVIAPAEVRI